MKSPVSCKLLFLAALLGRASNSFSASEPGTMLKVFTRVENNCTHFYAQNLKLANVTATFDLRLLNLQGSTHFPCTTTLAGNQTVEVFSLFPIQTNAPWNFTYTRSSSIGSAAATPDVDFVYSLPYTPGSSFRVSQGYHGSFSHTGPDEYSIDWRMPIGTPVHAARGGLVVKSKDDEDVGGPSRKYEKDANCILIQHSDGTIGIYGHLKQGGNKVKVGDQVKTGDLIALSGNTGFSNGPHLHFSVFKTLDGRTRLSLPVKFQSSNRVGITLLMGESYTAAPVDSQSDKNAPTIAGNSIPSFSDQSQNHSFGIR